MSIFDWSSAIKITFDRPIVTEVEQIIGVESGLMLNLGDYSGTPSASSQTSSTYSASKAFDTSLSTYWRPSSTTMPQWIEYNFGESVELFCIRTNSATSSYRPRGYIVQGSNDGVSYQDVTSGELPNTADYKDIEFTPATYQYWRLVITSLWSSRLYIYEIAFFPPINAYAVSGWDVVGQEPDMSPDGVVSSHSYSLKKITKTDSDYSVILWLKLTDRMKHPQGDVTVNFTGTLQGPGGAFVAPFSLSFTPQNITPFFNPNDVAATEVIAITGITSRIRVYYSSHEQEPDHLLEVVSASLSVLRTHIDDLET